MAVMRARGRDEPEPIQRIQNLIINVPPGTGKSRFVSVFTPAWMWLHWPAWRAIFFSGNPRIALRDADYCRILLESDWYVNTFCPKWSLAKDQNAKSLYRNTLGGFRMAISAGSRVTGDRADALFVDDPNDAAEAESVTVRDGINQWWDQGAANRVNDLRTATRVLIQQRLNDADLTGHVQKNGNWVSLVIPQEYEPSQTKETAIGWRDPRSEYGELMFPQRFPPNVIAAEKLRLGPYGYAGQHQQAPTPAGGGRFKEAWLKYFTRVGEYYRLWQKDGTFKQIPVSECDRFAMLDPAGTDKEQNDKACFSVLGCWDVTPTGDMLRFDQFREQIETPELADKSIEYTRRNDCQWIAVEKDGLGLGVVQNIRKRGVTIKPIKAKGSKEARSETAEIRMAAGMVYVPRDAPWVQAWITELVRFPKGEFADQVDEFAHAARMVHKMKGAPRTDEDETYAAVSEVVDARVAEDEEKEAKRRERMESYDEESMWTEVG